MAKKSLITLVSALLAVLTLFQAQAFAGEASTEIARDNGIYAIKDEGCNPYSANLAEIARNNTTFRSALWTGKELQVTVMNVMPGTDIGMEKHSKEEQLLYVVEGTASVQMGKDRENMNHTWLAEVGSAIIIPKGYWHNITNSGAGSLKLFSVYAPPHHPFGTVHNTKEDAD